MAKPIILGNIQAILIAILIPPFMVIGLSQFDFFLIFRTKPYNLTDLLFPLLYVLYLLPVIYISIAIGRNPSLIKYAVIGLLVSAVVIAIHAVVFLPNPKTYFIVIGTYLFVLVIHYLLRKKPG